MKKIKKYFMSYCRYTLRKEKEDFLKKTISLVDFDSINNSLPVIGKTIGIVVPEIGENAGGGSSILRIGTYLKNNNFNIIYIVYNSNDLKNTKKSADANIGNNLSEFVLFKDAKDMFFDIVIATSWASVYYAKVLNGYKMYFIQDYEPYFYEVGDEYFLSKRTYELGFHMISLGAWNKKKVLEQCGHDTVKIDSIEFPYEPSEYRMVNRNYASYANKKEINLVVYIKKSGRRIPMITQEILFRTKEMLKNDHIRLNIYFYGLNRKEKVLVGKNIGRLSKTELFTLYSKADFGMVASMTNISLVPYEMLATGLPVIEYSEGTFKYFLGEDSAILIDMKAESLYEQLLTCIQTPEKIEKLMSSAKKQISSLSWDKSCHQFMSIINELYK